MIKDSKATVVVFIVRLPRRRLPAVLEEVKNIGRDKNHDLFENTRGLHGDDDDDDDSNGDEAPSDSNIGAADGGIDGFGSTNSNEDDCCWCE